ncbi:YciE/YciF ferroxidase family protein [Rhodohalobacter sp. 614A]|uniref:YciE/YciF ferroxidase family protein n=1 Tax=Rhodohalobacter sp. 614A TaxID=2908649 RepID=UPI001F2C5544|nr:ferritin-like domain-containing protein [Rhodohalobacter sp. 614A]
MGELNNLEDLFHHQLKDIYSAEKQLIKALPTMVENASNEQLQKAFEEHLEETKGHKKRLEEIGEELDLDLSGETCNAMKGLIEEAEEFISENPDLDVKDAGIIADAQRIEHYEISAYGTAVTFAEALGHNNAAKKLQQTLDEESEADATLNELAIESVNPRAKSV